MKKYDDMIIKYFDGELSTDEIREFEQELESNTELKEVFDNYRKVNELFSNNDEQLAGRDYFNGIVPRFRQNLDKVSYKFPVFKFAAAFAAILIIFSSYLLFKDYLFDQSVTNDSIQSITDDLTEEEMNELADYISDDYWNPISGEEKLQILEETDFSLDGVFADVSVEESVMILSDYQINDIYSLADEKEFEMAYNEILTKSIF